MTKKKVIPAELTEREKLDNYADDQLEYLNKNFRKQLYSIDGLSSEQYGLADILKDYVDKRFDLLLEDLKNKSV